MFPQKKKSPSFGKSAPPFSKKHADDLESPDPVEGKAMDDAEEAAETANEQSAEDADYGANLTADIDAVFEGAGIDKTQGRDIAAKLFSAVARCLGGGDDAGIEHDTGGMDLGDAAGDAEIYGR